MDGSAAHDRFEAEHDDDTFTVRFPSGYALTAWADGRLVVTKAVGGFKSFALNIADLRGIRNGGPA